MPIDFLGIRPCTSTPAFGSYGREQLDHLRAPTRSTTYFGRLKNPSSEVRRNGLHLLKGNLPLRVRA
jgi:hypothetical protein